MESMNTQQLSEWSMKLAELLSAPEDEREYPPWQIAVGDHLEKFAKSWNSSRIAELESQILHQTAISACRIEERERLRAQVAALQEIAITEKAYHIYYRCQGDCGRCVCSAGAHKKDARRQLEEEHPKLFQQIGE